MKNEFDTVQAAACSIPRITFFRSLFSCLRLVSCVYIDIKATTVYNKTFRAKESSYFKAAKQQKKLTTRSVSEPVKSFELNLQNYIVNNRDSKSNG